MSHAYRLLVFFALIGLTGCSSMLSGLHDPGSLEYRQAMQAQFDRESAHAPEPAPAQSVAALLAEGDEHLRKGERRIALLRYLEARRLQPDAAKPLVRIGFYYLSEDTERAAAIFASVIASDADTASAHAGMGLARLAQGRYPEARSAFEQALEIDAELPAALDALGALTALEDDTEGGLAFAQRAYAARPRDAFIVNNLGVAQLRADDFVNAEKTFRTAILLDPAGHALYNNLGIALGRQGRYDEAAAAFSRFGDDVAVHNNLGYVYYLNGDLDPAIRHFEAALVGVQGADRIRVLQNLRDATDRHTAAQQAMVLP